MTTMINQSRADQISKVCDGIKAMLIEKNKNYGDSALSPIRVFSKAPAAASIMTRLDDKISRIKNSNELRKNDTIDLLGYLVLLCIANDWANFEEQID